MDSVLSDRTSSGIYLWTQPSSHLTPCLLPHTICATPQFHDSMVISMLRLISGGNDMRQSEAFCAADADVILQSSDEIRFGVYRLMLVESSPFFRDMFSLPQAGASVTEDSSSCAAPIVEVSETGEIIDALLKLTYPGADPELKTLEEISVLLAAAIKYDMSRAIATLRRILVSPAFVEKEPVRVYAVACRYDLQPEASIASTYTLSTNVLDSPLSEELKYITAWSYRRLLDLHRRRADAILKLLETADVDNIKCLQCHSAHYGSLSPPRWWTQFLGRAKEELRFRPTSGVIFSMKFLAESGQTGCGGCMGSVLASHAFLESLRKSIDELPDRV